MAEVYLQVEAEVGGAQMDPRHRAGRVQVQHVCLKARHAIGVVGDVQFVRPNIQRGRATLGVRIVGLGQLQAAQQHPAVLHPALKDVDVAEEIHHEGVGRVLEDFLRRADLLDSPSCITTTRSATSKASS